jgi:hypothetical protein
VARAAIAALAGHTLRGHLLNINDERPKNWRGGRGRR